MPHPKNAVAGSPGTPPLVDKRICVNDRRFVRQIRLLRDLHAFLLFSGKRLDPQAEGRLKFGSLKLAIFDRRGSSPTTTQWNDLDAALGALFGLLDETLRRKFLLTQFPAWLPRIAVGCLLLVILSLFAGVAFTVWSISIYLSFLSYVVWLLSMGTLGAISFVAMNVLSVQEDVTFDLTSDRFLAVRLIIGALFGLVLSIPFAFPVFLEFARAMAGYYYEMMPSLPVLKDPDAWRKAWVQAVFLLLPFILGFSTTLVIVVLNRLVDGAQSIFGGLRLSSLHLTDSPNSTGTGNSISGNVSAPGPGPSRRTNLRKFGVRKR
jgi:hypothetical protein